MSCICAMVSHVHYKSEMRFYLRLAADLPKQGRLLRSSSTVMELIQGPLRSAKPYTSRSKEEDGLDLGAGLVSDMT